MRASLLLAPFAALVLSGCGPLDRFDVPLSTSGTVPGAVGGHLGTEPNLSTFGGSARQTIGNKGVKPEQIDSARLKSGNVTVEADPSNLGFFQKFEIYALADGQPRVRVASAPDLASASPVRLAIDDVELKPYVTSESFAIELDAPRRNGQPRSDTPLTIDLVLTVDLATP